jgi:tRNA pseudouridine55 synthase
LGRARQAGRAGLDSRCQSGASPVRRTEGRPWRNARSAGQRRAADCLGRGDQDRALRHGRKEYRFTLCFGQARSTEDAEGEVTATSDLRPTDEEIRRALAAFVGDIEQVPPAFSALKVEGKRAYDLARAGQPVDLKPRRVLIERLALLGRPDTDHADFVVSCGKGTYIRSLGRDLALSLGTVGHLSALRRTAVGPFREDAAISLPKLEALGHIPALLGVLAPVATALDDIPALALTEAQADRLRQGQPVLLTRDAPPSGALLRAETGSRLVALVRSDGTSLKPVRVFNL